MARFVWLASYPKSGNTWVRLFLAALERDHDLDLARPEGVSSIASARSLIERPLDIALADLSPDDAADLRPLAYREMAKRAEGTILLKTHDAYGATPSGEPMFPSDVSAGCVHILRDPRDMCLSLASHNGVAIDAAIDAMARSTRTSTTSHKKQLREIRGSWSEHCASWRAAPMPRLEIRYEDMLADPIRRLGAIARFCGHDPTPEALARAVARTAFERLAVAEQERGFSERPRKMERFFRAGRAGLWRETLTAEQIARIESDHGETMRSLGYALVAERAAPQSLRP